MAEGGLAMTDSVEVSVVIAAFNAAESLVRAVNSVTAQTLGDLEILVVDDGSTDDTAVIASALAAGDPRVRVLGDGRNHGVSAARNIGFAAARGTWIAVLDADDAFEPDRVERLLAAAAEHGADMVADDQAYWDWHARRITGRAIGGAGGGVADEVERIDIERFFANCITGRSPFDYGQLKVMIRRAFVEQHRLRYIEGMRHGEDFMLYAHALLAGARFVRIADAGYLYTQRVGAVSRARSQVARTIENNDQMRERTLELLADPRVAQAPRLAALLRRRARAIRWHASWEAVYHPLHDRRFDRVVAAAVRDWRIPPLLAHALARRLAGRFGRMRRDGRTST